MYVQCPSCEAIFRVTTRDLTHADGLVRCGQCLEVFNGLDRLRALQPDTEPGEDEDTGTQEQVTHSANAPQMELPVEQVILAEPSFPHSTDSFDASTADEPEAISESDLGPSVQRSRRAGSTILWGLTNLVLILTLVGQYVYAERRELYQYPELQPWLEHLCALARCDLPPRRDTSRIELLNRNVYSHPNIADALMITATLVNTAPHAQPFPLIELSLSDLQGQIVAMRRFQPREYLSGGGAGTADMEPGVPIGLTLEILDPGSHALAFEFDFL